MNYTSTPAIDTQLNQTFLNNPMFIKLVLFNLIVGIFLQILVGSFQIWRMMVEIKANKELSKLDYLIYKRFRNDK
jgi:hypothetical protein